MISFLKYVRYLAGSASKSQSGNNYGRVLYGATDEHPVYIFISDVLFLSTSIQQKDFTCLWPDFISNIVSLLLSQAASFFSLSHMQQREQTFIMNQTNVFQSYFLEPKSFSHLQPVGVPWETSWPERNLSATSTCSVTVATYPRTFNCHLIVHFTRMPRQNSSCFFWTRSCYTRS